MGAAASALNTISAHQRARKFTKDKFLPELLALFDFDKICDANKTVSLDDVAKALELCKDVFLTHNWGKDQANHKLVALINAGLEKRGLCPWFDEFIVNQT